MMENSKKLPGTCILMAGGKGERMGNPQKFLIEVKGMTILERLFVEIKGMFDSVYIAATSVNNERIREKCKECNILVTSGDYYVSDLHLALRRVQIFPVLVFGADTLIFSMDSFLTYLDIGYSVGKDLVNLISRKSGFNASIFKRAPLSLTEVLDHTDILIPDSVGMNINTPDDLRRAQSIIVSGGKKNQ
jgi:GTP:adenosylcobinamide-phosphate guanylyltransferase